MRALATLLLLLLQQLQAAQARCVPALSRSRFASGFRNTYQPSSLSRVQTRLGNLRGHAGSNMWDILKDLNKNGGAAAQPSEGDLKQAQEMQQGMMESVKKTKEKLESARYEGYSKDESVRWITNGNLETVSVDITQEAMKQGREKISELLTEASKDAFKESVTGMRENMASFAKDMYGSNPMLSQLGGGVGNNAAAKLPPTPPGAGNLPKDQDDFPSM
eukprot:jgi/Bigna1/85786/estExt_fgenesh1_pg.C_60114